MDGSVGTAMGRLGLEHGDWDKGLDAAAAKANKFKSEANDMTGALQTVGVGIAGFGAVVTGGLGLAINAAGNFEAQVNAIQAVMNPADWNQYGDAIKDTALRLGQDYPVSALEAAAAMEEL